MTLQEWLDLAVAVGTLALAFTAFFGLRDSRDARKVMERSAMATETLAKATEKLPRADPPKALGTRLVSSGSSKLAVESHSAPSRLLGAPDRGALG